MGWYIKHSEAEATHTGIRVFGGHFCAMWWPLKYIPALHTTLNIKTMRLMVLIYVQDQILVYHYITSYDVSKRHRIFFLISWRLITLQYCSGFCHTLTWISLGYTCIPHPSPPSHLPFHPVPLGLPSAPALSTCLMHPTWAGGLFHHR